VAAAAAAALVLMVDSRLLLHGLPVGLTAVPRTAVDLPGNIHLLMQV